MSGFLAGSGGQDRYERPTAHLDPPFAVVNLAAFDSNTRDLARRVGGLPIRVVSKSLRCRHLIECALARPGYRGVMWPALLYALPVVRRPGPGVAADGLGIGDRVWLRHAKGGELAERLTEYHLISPDEPAPVSVPTYRGEGQCFG